MGRRLKGATFVNAEAVYSLSLPEDPVAVPQSKRAPEKAGSYAPQ